jgi:proteasome lid subunit RPN8/RPN11
VTLVISSDLVDAIRIHAEAAYPEEAAGLLLGGVEGGDRRRITQVLPLANRWEADARGRRYRLEPLDLIAAEDLADAQGLMILGIFHSHPDHPAQPSAFDLEQALPFYTYLITRVDSGAVVESRAWRLTDDRARFEAEPLDLLAQPRGQA